MNSSRENWLKGFLEGYAQGYKKGNREGQQDQQDWEEFLKKEDEYWASVAERVSEKKQNTTEENKND